MNQFVQNAKWYLQYLAVRVLLSIVQSLSLNVCDRISYRIAHALTFWVPVRKKTIEENLTAVFPEWSTEKKSEVTFEMWRYLIMKIFEIAHAPRKIHQTNWRKYVRIPDPGSITGPLMDVRPTLLVSGHFGNFELGGYITGLLGFSTHTMVRKLDNPFLDRWVNEFRSRNGQFMLDKDGSANKVSDLMDEGGTITVLGDQAAGRKGCWIDFLGRPASCHKAVALFTLTGGTPMVLCVCRRLGKPLEFEITSPGTADPESLEEDQADIKSLTQWYNDQLAHFALEYPEQYWWVHRRWKDSPPRKAIKNRPREKAA